MTADLQDHPMYDALKAKGLTDAQIKAQIDAEDEMVEFERENAESIEATERAEARKRRGE